MVRMIMRAILLLPLMCASASALDPKLDVRQYGHTAWTARDGLSVGAIFAMAQTPDGYLWLGSEFGLFRFDGVHAIPWQPPAGQHLPAEPYSLLVTRDGTLWIGTFNGLVSWNGGKLTQYPGLDGQFVTSLLEDRDGTVWAGTLDATSSPSAGRLCAMRDGSAQCYLNDGAFGSFVWSLGEDSSGTLWVGAESVLWRWKPGPPKRYAMPGMRIGDLSRADDGRVLIGADHAGLMQFAGDKLEAYPIHSTINPNALLADRDADSNKLLRDRDGGLWIGTHTRGLIHVHHGRTEVLTKADGLSNDIICSLFEDREGNVWVGTTKGLDRFRELPVTTIFENQGLSIADTHSVVADTDGSLWVAARDGLMNWKYGKIHFFNKSSGLPDDKVQSLYQDDRGRIWAYTGHGLAFFMDGRFVAVNTAIPSEEVYSITGDKAGNLWLSGNKGLSHLLEGRLVEHFAWSALGRRQQAKAILFDRKRGGIWLSFWTDGGVLYFKDGQVRASFTAADGLGKGHVSGLQLDRDGSVWAATEGGLSRIKDGRIATLTSKNGLPCDTIHWSIEDDDRSVWLYTACGLVRITRNQLDAWIVDPKRGIETTVWDAADGVTLRAVTPSSFGPPVAKSADGKLWFLTGEDSVDEVDPRHLVVNKVPPPVHIEQIAADHKIYWQNSTGAKAPKISLPPGTHDLAIDYTALSFVAPEKLHFKYKLEGQDPDWREVVNDRQVQYSNLAPRDYRFRVMASNDSGVWNEQGDTLYLSVAPAYYQTNRFRVVGVAAFLALLWTLYQLRIQQLGRQEKQLRDVINTVPANVWSASPDGAIDFVNQRWQDLTGLAPRHAMGWRWEAVFHPDDLPRFLARWNTALSTGQPMESEARVRKLDGEYRWLFIRNVPLRDARGKILKWYGSAIDIDDRKRTEEALRQSESYLADAQRLTHTGSWASDANIREPKYWSDEMFRILGFDPQDGLPTAQETWQRIHPEDRDKVKKQRDRALRDKAAYEVEYRIILPNGAIKHIHGSGHPVFSPEGDIVGVVGTNVEITERKLAEEALKRSETYLAEAQRLSHTGSWAWDPRTDEMLHCSEEIYRIFGFDQLDGLPSTAKLLERVHPEDRDRARENSTHGASEFEYRLVMPNGTIKYVVSVRQTIVDRNGTMTEAIGTAVDVTERKRAEQERDRLRQLEADLAHVNRVSMLGELAASLSHELKQPISAAITNANTCLRWLRRDQPDIEEACEAVKRIVQDGNRAADVIDHLRSLYKQVTPAERELVDVNEVIREMLVLLRSEADRRATLMCTYLAAELPRVKADRVQLQQVFLNLMLNGIEAMNETGGELTIASELCRHGEVLISVRDAGVGLPSEKADQIFNAFFTTKPQGSGMGLAISRSIVESHGGRLWATSNTGRGATFQFTLPTNIV